MLSQSAKISHLLGDFCILSEVEGWRILKSMQSTITFYGGAGSVTGSNFLLDTGGTNILVDCGLFQGKHSFENSNWDPFPFNPSEISFLINTHAHIDHIGRIPKLVRDGFRGPIISTEATQALAEPLLLDALNLSRHESEVRGLPPLYEEKDIAQAMSQWQGVSYGEKKELADGVSVELLDAGHILGSAIARFSRGGEVVAFTGDLGGGNSPLLAPVTIPKDVQYLVMESVYGNRTRPDDSDRRELLAGIIKRTAERGGGLLIPAFSTERTQDLLFEIRSLMMEQKIPSMPVYLDSPLAEKITQAYIAHPQYFSEAIQKRTQGGEHIFAFPQLHMVESAEDSQSIQAKKETKILIAGSGMSNGGRVLSHEAAILPDDKSTLLIVGYQAAGSLGRRLAEGAKTVSIQGTEVAVRARVEMIYGYSAHMDGEQLLEFAHQVGDSLKQVFVVMGEPAASGFLVQRIRDYLGLSATAPDAGEKATIDF